MDYENSRLLIIPAAVVVGLIIGGIVQYFRRLHNQRNMPTEDQKQKVFELIRQWKVKGFDYSKRLKSLKKKGYTNDVANLLLGEYESTSRNT
jgi:muramoyltetrapeptide carboxypeptidase LdcA involved in peptidoglycan recycling